MFCEPYEKEIEEKKIFFLFIYIIHKYTCIVLTDINECRRDGICSPNAVCVNEPGSYACICDDGFTGDGIVCRGTHSTTQHLSSLELIMSTFLCFMNHDISFNQY